MTLEQARRYLEANGYVVTEVKGGGFRVLNTATQESGTGTAADIIAMAGELRASTLPSWWDKAWGEIPRDEDDEVDWENAIKIADKLGAFGEQLPYFASYTEAQREAAKRTKDTASQVAPGAGPSFAEWVGAGYPASEWRGTPAFTFEVVPLASGGYTVRVKVAEAPSGAMSQAEAEAEAARLGTRYEAIRDPATGQWYVDLKEQVAPSGAMSQAEAEAEATRLGSKYEAVRDPQTGLWYVQLREQVETQGQVFDTYADALEAAPQGFQPVQRSDGKWVFERVETGKPTEQYLGTVEEGGWQIDQYGYVDADGKTVITARQPRQPIKDPILSLDELISQALVDVDFNDPTDPGLAKAQSLFDFKNQPTSQEKLQMALQIAQSPSDYLTLVALYTGAIQRETPARVGERIAPLAPILQMMAQRFFLDIPGINHVPTQEETAAINPVTGKPYAPGEALATAREAGTEAGVTTGPIQPPPGWGTNKYVPNDTWNSWTPEQREHFMDTGEWPAEPEDRPTIPMAASLTSQQVPGLLGGGVAVQGQGGPSVPSQGPGGVSVGQEFPGFLGGAPSATGPGFMGSEATRLASQVAQEMLSVQQSKPQTTQQQVQAAQGTPLSRTAAQAAGTSTVGGLDTSLSMLGSVGKFLEEIAKQDKKPATVPKFQAGGVVPGYLGQPQLAQVEGGEMVLTPEQIQALLQQSGMFGPVYRPDLQQLPQFLAQPRRVSLSQLTGGALRPRSLQTIRQQSPTQRALTLEMAKGFGVPQEDFLEEEQLATSIGGPRRMARFNPATIRTGR